MLVASFFVFPLEAYDISGIPNAHLINRNIFFVRVGIRVCSFEDWMKPDKIVKYMSLGIDDDYTVLIRTPISTILNALSPISK